MPAIGTSNAQERTANALEDLLDKLDELAAARPPEVIVNVPEGKPPTVHVAASQRVRAWRFKVTRDADGFIDYVDAFPRMKE